MTARLDWSKTRRPQPPARELGAQTPASRRYVAARLARLKREAEARRKRRTT